MTFGVYDDVDFAEIPEILTKRFKRFGPKVILELYMPYISKKGLFSEISSLTIDFDNNLVSFVEKNKTGVVDE